MAFNETGASTMKAAGTGDYVALAIWGDNNISSGNNWGALDLYRGISGTNTLIGRLSTSYNDLSIQAQSDRNIRIHDNAGKGIFVQEGGNVYIGAATYPSTSAKFEIVSASLGSVSICEGLVGGAPGNTTGMLNVTTNVGGGKWAAQMRADHSTANGLFVRAGSGTSYYTAYLTGYDENDVHMVVRGDGKVAIGDETAPTAQLHIFTGDSGFSGAIDTDYDEFCIEGSGNVGMTILSPAANYGSIVFGDNADKDMGRIKYYHGDDSMQFFVNNNADDSMRIISSGKVGIGATSPNALLHLSSSTAVGDATNPALQIGEAGNYRMGMYTTNEGAYIENKNGDDGIIFRVKTAGEAMRIDGGDGQVGIGTTAPDGTLHTHTGTAGSITANANADDLVVENSNHGGMSILTPNDKSGIIYFVAPATNIAAQLYYDNNGQEMKLGTNESSGYLILATASNTEAMRIDSSQNILFQTANQKISGSSSSTGSFGVVSAGGNPDLSAGGTGQLQAIGGKGAQNTLLKLNSNSSGVVSRIFLTDGASWSTSIGADTDGDFVVWADGTSATAGTDVFHVQRADGKVGIGTASPDGNLHVHTATAGSVTAAAAADDLVIENSDHTGISLLTPDDKAASIYFGNPSDNLAAYLQYDYGTNALYFSTHRASAKMYFNTATATTAMTIDASQNVGIGTTSPGYNLEVAGTFYSAGSSVSYKENVEDLEVDSSLIHSLRAVSYDYKKKYKDFGYDVKEGKQMGLISEEVAETIPELAIMKDGKPKNVDYQKLAVVLLAEVQNLKKEVEELKCR